MAQEEIQKPAASITASVPVKEETHEPVTTEKSVTIPAMENTEEKVVSPTVPEVDLMAVKEEEIVQTELIKEESYLVSELAEAEKKALEELKEMVMEALKKHDFTAPPVPEAPVKEEKKEEKTEVETKEVKPEEKSVVVETKTEEKSVVVETKTEEKSVVAETKTEEKSLAPDAVEPKKEEKFSALAPVITETKPAAPIITEKSVTPTPVETKPAAPIVTETKKEEKLIPVETKPAIPVTTEIKKEEKSVTPTPVETKPASPLTTEIKKEEKSVTAAPVDIKPAAPLTTKTKKEEKLIAPVTTETTKEEKSAPVETKPAGTVTTETKKEDKSAPVDTKPATPVTIETKAATPITTETKKEEKATASTLVETKPATPNTTETMKEEEKPTIITIAKAFAADQEDKTKTIESTTLPEPEDISIWGIPLLKDERSNTILLKFLRARDFKVKEAFTMLKNTIQWRKDNNIDELIKQDLEDKEFEKMVFTHGVDKQGHVVIYSSYGEFQNKEIFSDKEKLNKFLKWRIQFQEKCVRSLDFSPEAKSSFVFVSDFRNAPGLGKRQLWQFIRRAVKQFEDNYPEFVAKELFINAPWWYIPYYKTFGSIIASPRTRSKMVLAVPSKSADTIFKYVAPEVVPVKYGGLSKESPLTAEDGVTEAVVKSTAKYTIDLPVSEGSTLSWELRVLGAEVTYGAQFEPSNEISYTVIVSKNRKIGLSDEPVITGSYKASEPGKVVITIDNQTSKKKKLLYRFKTQP